MTPSTDTQALNPELRFEKEYLLAVGRKRAWAR